MQRKKSKFAGVGGGYRARIATDENGSTVCVISERKRSRVLHRGVDHPKDDRAEEISNRQSWHPDPD